MKKTIVYKIKYLPIAVKDLSDITDYLARVLCNKKAALDFIDALDRSISRIQSFPYSCEIYHAQSLTDSEYRVLPVSNYLVFYVVLDNTVEIRRIVYNRVDLNEILKHSKQE